MSLESDARCAELAGLIGDAVKDRGVNVAVAESLSAGMLSMRLGAAARASQWFAGAVVAYEPETKFRVLGVQPGPLVSERCALQMAQGVRTLMNSDVGIATTGVGGPEPDEGMPAGSTWIAVLVGSYQHTSFHRFDGEPAEVLHQTCLAALQETVEALSAAPSSR